MIPCHYRVHQRLRRIEKDFKKYRELPTKDLLQKNKEKFEKASPFFFRVKVPGTSEQLGMRPRCMESGIRTAPLCQEDVIGWAFGPFSNPTPSPLLAPLKKRSPLG
jgi:hypothetical protein